MNNKGVFQGGSSIGGGITARKFGDQKALTLHLTGYMRIKAESTEDARELVNGNPVYGAGGKVEIRELPRN